jgi:hypothetical protein
VREQSRALASTLGPLAIYALLSLGFFGRALLRHGDRDYLGLGYDPQIFIWSLGWWPHAILDGENPFVTEAMWPVVGVNLTWVTSVPGLALVAAPLTLLAGPVLAYNVVSVALPALAAWTAFLLCRYLTGSWWASVAGGYLFGFSSYMISHVSAGHANLSSVFLVPLVALTVLQYVDARIGGRALAVRIGLLLGAEIYLSTEVFATLTVALLASLVVAFVLVPDVRARLRTGVRPLLGALAVALVVAAPLLGYALTDYEGDRLADPAQAPADMANLVVPTETTLVREEYAKAIAGEFIGPLAEQSAYLGLPLIAILGWFAWQRRRRPAGRLLVVLLALGIVAELGVELRISGDRVVPLPWALAAKLPGLEHAIPGRFAMYVSLGAAVAVALWGASRRPAALVRVGLIAAAVIALLPAVSRDLWDTTPTRPSFFADDVYRKCFRSDENVFVPDPAGADATLWQAESDYEFRLANGLIPQLTDAIPDHEAVRQVLFNQIPEGGGQRVVRLARGIDATVILLDAEHAWWGPELVEAGLEPVEVGAVRLYHLRPARPSCG